MASEDTSSSGAAEGQERSYSIGELANAAGTTPRTIRYYQAEGLLPPAGSRGRYTVYGREHLDRLKVILQLKEAFLPLAAIRAQLGRLNPEQIRLLSGHNVHVMPEDVADPAAYLGKLIDTRSLPDTSDAAPRKRALLVLPSVRQAAAGVTWTRLTLAEGVELNVRKGALAEEKLAALADALRQSIADSA